ncbi:MAG: hypothetical protein AAF799_30920 [Myxococcota bacterium]
MAQASVLTKVDSPPLPGDPSGACSKCRASTMTVNGQNEADIELYYQDDGQSTTADLQFDLHLKDGSWQYVTIYNQQLVDQTSTSHTIEGDSSWNWDDVEEVYVEVVPG